MALGTDFLTRYFSRKSRKATAQKMEQADIEQDIPVEVKPVAVNWEVYQGEGAPTGEDDRTLLGNTTNPRQYLQTAIELGEPTEDLTFVCKDTGDILSGDELRKEACVPRLLMGLTGWQILLVL